MKLTLEQCVEAAVTVILSGPACVTVRGAEKGGTQVSPVLVHEMDIANVSARAGVPLAMASNTLNTKATPGNRVHTDGTRATVIPILPP
jgi:hypothetical protein